MAINFDSDTNQVNITVPSPTTVRVTKPADVSLTVTEKGIKGDKGDTGPQGEQGIQGVQGIQGIQGVQGETGSTGPEGPQGIQGLPGVDGADGADGAGGADGADGAVGPEGPQGIQGIQGTQGVQGVPGNDGADGADGSDGVGVPAGGTAGQALVKIDGTDYNTQWSIIDSSPWTTTGSDIYYNTGNVGIGTSSPVYKIHGSADGQAVASGLQSGTAPTIAVTGSSQNVINSAVVGSATAAHRPVQQYRRARGTLSSPSAVVNNDALGSLIAGGYDGTSVQFGAAVDFFVDGTVTTGTVPTRVSIVTGDNSGNRAERLVVKSDGNVGIGTTTPAQPLHVNGTIRTVGSGYSTDIVTHSNGGLTIGENISGVQSQAVNIGRSVGRFNSGTQGVLIGQQAGYRGTYSHHQVAIGSSSNSGGAAYSKSGAIGIGASSNYNGSDNTTSVGAWTGVNSPSSYTNSAFFGYSAGHSGGNNSVFVGYEAGKSDGVQLVSDTVAVGYQALTALTTGAGNTAVGYQAGDALTTGANNTLLGYSAGTSLTGSNNTILGYEAGLNASGYGNQVYVGYRAGAGFSGDDDQCVMVGSDAGGSNMGAWGVGVGFRANYNTSGYGIVGVGYHANRTNTGAYSIGIGLSAGYNSSGENSIRIGKNSGYSSTGANTIAIGADSLKVTTADYTVAVGYEALTALTTGTGNTAVGYQAGNTLTTNSKNTLFGYQVIAGGSDNTAFGYQAMNSVSGDTRKNVAVGSLAGVRTGVSVANVFVGYNAGNGGSGDNNIFLGESAGQGSTGSDNIGFGGQTGRNATGTRNVWLGRNIGYIPGSVSYSVVVGYDAKEAENVVAVGYQAGNSSSAYSVFLGYQAGASETNDNRLYIENSNSTTPLIYGEFDNDILRVNGTLQVNDPSSTGYALPAATGTLGQVLEVDANGDLAFASNVSFPGFGTTSTTALAGDTTTITSAQASAITANTAKNSYPSADASKLAGIAAGAEVNVNADWNATSGDAQILNKPVIPTNTNIATTNLTFSNTRVHDIDGNSLEFNINGGDFIVKEGATNRLEITPQNLSIEGITYPSTDGTNGQVLTTNGSGSLSFTTASGGGGGLGGADQTLTADRTIDTNGFNLDIELDPTGTADTFTIHDGTHDLFQVDTSTTGTLFSVNDVSGLPMFQSNSDGTMALPQILTAAPTGTAPEGTMQLGIVSGTCYLYVYINGGWKSTTLA